LKENSSEKNSFNAEHKPFEMDVFKENEMNRSSNKGTLCSAKINTTVSVGNN
jgi:hypothetical protein